MKRNACVRSAAPQEHEQLDRLVAWTQRLEEILEGSNNISPRGKDASIVNTIQEAA